MSAKLAFNIAKVMNSLALGALEAANLREWTYTTRQFLARIEMQTEGE
jgi:hypothetical protein